LFLNHGVEISGRFYEEDEKENNVHEQKSNVCFSQAQMLDGNLVYWMFNIDNTGM